MTQAVLLFLSASICQADQDAAAVYEQYLGLFDVRRIRSGIVEYWADIPKEGESWISKVWFCEDKFRTEDTLRKTPRPASKGARALKELNTTTYYDGQVAIEFATGSSYDGPDLTPLATVNDSSAAVPQRGNYDLKDLLYDRFRTAGFYKTRPPMAIRSLSLQVIRDADGKPGRELTIHYEYGGRRVLLLEMNGPPLPISIVELDPKGRPREKLSTAEWWESNGVYIPKEWTWDLSTRGVLDIKGGTVVTPESIKAALEGDGEVTWSTSHTTVVSANFNVPIPDEIFEATIPQGMRVQDNRFNPDGRPLVHHAKVPLPQDAMAKATGIPDYSQLSSRSQPGVSRRTILAGCLFLAAVTLSLLGWWTYRRQKS